MIGFLWERWPGTRVGPALSGWLDTGLVVAGAVVLTFVGQFVVYSRFDASGVFTATTAVPRAPTFPSTMPLAAAAFVAMLEIALVNEGWPVQRLGKRLSGPIALLMSWGAAVCLYLLLVETHPKPGSGMRALHGPFSGEALGALLVCLGLWQLWFFVSLRGRPFIRIPDRRTRLLVANLVVVGIGSLSYFALRRVGWGPSTISCAGAVAAAALLLQGMLFDGWPGAHHQAATALLWLVALTAGVSAAIYGALKAIADHAHWTTTRPDQWMSFACLNAIGVGVILHVGIGQRWPFGRPPDPRR
jgi:hypothetical protein